MEKYEYELFMNIEFKILRQIPSRLTRSLSHVLTYIQFVAITFDEHRKIVGNFKIIECNDKRRFKCISKI